MIKSWWIEAPVEREGLANLVLKLKYLRYELRKWSKVMVGKITTRKHEVIKEVQELDEIGEDRNVRNAEWKDKMEVKVLAAPGRDHVKTKIRSLVALRRGS